MKKIMLTSRVFGQSNDLIFKYARENGYSGIEWYLNLKRLSINPEKNKDFLNKMEENRDLSYAFHLPTNDVEIGYYQEKYAETSLNYLMMYIDFLKPWLIRLNYRPVFTMHIGANSIAMDRLNWTLTKRNLKILGDYIYQANGLLCLENLKKGWTAEVEKIIELVQFAGINITFDTGHAASSPSVLNKEMTLVEYLNRLRPYIKYAHFYYYESLAEGKHIPPASWDEIKEAWLALKALDDRIEGITLELTSIVDLEQTFAILKGRGPK